MLAHTHARITHLRHANAAHKHTNQTHTCIHHTCTRARGHTHARARIHTRIHTSRQTHTYANTYTHTYTHPLCSYIDLLVNSSATVLFATLYYRSMQTGGFGFIGQSFFMLIPMVTLVAQDRRHGVFWFAMALCQVAAMGILHATGYFRQKLLLESELSLGGVLPNLWFDFVCWGIMLLFLKFYNDCLAKLLQVICVHAHTQQTRARTHLARHPRPLSNPPLSLPMQAHKDSEEAEKSKDRFFSTVSHELRAPLFPVLSSLDLVLQTDGLTSQVG